MRFVEHEFEKGFYERRKNFLKTLPAVSVIAETALSQFSKRQCLELDHSNKYAILAPTTWIVHLLNKVPTGLGFLNYKDNPLKTILF